MQDLDLIVHKGAELGLHLNPRKLKIICHDDASMRLVPNAFPGAQVIVPDNATLLGSATGDVACTSAILEEKNGMLRTMGDRLKFLFYHDAILLVHHFFAIPKLLYILKTSPCFLSLRLQKYDNLLMSTVSIVLSTSISRTQLGLKQYFH